MDFNEESVRFPPSDVDGMENVIEAAVFPDRLELQSEVGRVVYFFREIGRWPRFGWLYRRITWLGVRGRPLIADRDWFHPPARRFFQFYTNPPITIYMPDEPEDLNYSATIFRRVQNVIESGGFSTFDLG